MDKDDTTKVKIHSLFGDDFNDKIWETEYKGMPEFIQEDKEPIQKIIISFETQEDVEDFGKLVGQNITTDTKSLWFPKQNNEAPKNFVYLNETENTLPKYPIYIISKGRWESRLTSKALEKLNVPYRIVVEPSEYEQYASVIDPSKILTLPEDFSKLGQGSIPVRNWCWEHSIKEGHKRHWILDDNILNFQRLNRNRRLYVGDGTIFRCVEEFTDRYENVAFSGFNYRYFIADRNVNIPAFYLNTRVYSMTLIKNDLPYRWRGRYNEDTDICLRALKDGWCTLLFNTFLGSKTATLKMKGGNTDTIYNTGDERLEFAESLQKQHPDIVKVVRRYDRWHHEVDYSGFRKNKLIKVKDLDIKDEINNYGMVLKHYGK